MVVVVVVVVVVVFNKVYIMLVNMFASQQMPHFVELFYH